MRTNTSQSRARRRLRQHVLLEGLKETTLPLQHRIETLRQLHRGDEAIEEVLFQARRASSDPLQNGFFCCCGFSFNKSHISGVIGSSVAENHGHHRRFRTDTVVRADAQNGKKSSTSSHCKNDHFLCENSMFGARWTGPRFGMAHLRVTSAFNFSCFLKFFSFYLLSFSFFSGKNTLQALVSEFNEKCFLRSPWRCSVLTTKGGRAGFGLGHLSKREHDSTPGMEWRLPAAQSHRRERKRSVPHIGLLLWFFLIIEGSTKPHNKKPRKSIEQTAAVAEAVASSSKGLAMKTQMWTQRAEPRNVDQQDHHPGQSSTTWKPTRQIWTLR